MAIQPFPRWRRGRLALRALVIVTVVVVGFPVLAPTVSSSQSLEQATRDDYHTGANAFLATSPTTALTRGERHPGPSGVFGSDSPGPSIELSTVPYVADTLVLNNNTLLPGNVLAGQGIGPTDAIYDAAKGQVFVSDTGSGIVSVISDATDTVVASIPVSSPGNLVYDSERGEIFVVNSPEGLSSCAGVNSACGTVNVISDSTDRVTATIAVGGDPVGVAYDPANGEVFVTNSATYNVSVISDSSDTVTSTIPLIYSPYDVAFDSAKGELFVTTDTCVNGLISGIASPPLHGAVGSAPS